MNAIAVHDALQEIAGLEVVRDERQARRTSYRIGGPAVLSATANTYAALVDAIQVLDRFEVEWVVLGRGTNVLVSDAGYEGCILRLGKEFSSFSFGPNGQMTAGAGVLLPRLVAECQSEGLAGLEMCVGVPGSVGGAISMNAGTRVEWISKRVTSVVTYHPGQGLCRYDASEIEWGYRSTSLPAGEVILEATFELRPDDQEAIGQRMERLASRRRKHQPLGMPSCGSVFRNPPDQAVGKLVEACGLKGYTVGGAQVSPVHANFVVNTGKATANDVLTVITKMHDEVLARYDIELRPEVKFLGFA